MKSGEKKKKKTEALTPPRRTEEVRSAADERELALSSARRPEGRGGRKQQHRATKGI